jgi:hypothetical protein
MHVAYTNNNDFFNPLYIVPCITSKPVLLRTEDIPEKFILYNIILNGEHIT